MDDKWSDDIISLDIQESIWDRFYKVFSLVLIGTRDERGDFNQAPKHMAMPMGWDNFFGFMSTPEHSTYHNIKREAEFTVTYPRPPQVVLTSLAAAPRNDDNFKPSLTAITTRPAESVNGVFVKDGYAFLECNLTKIIEGFGRNSLIVGQVIRAHIHKNAIRLSEEDDGELIRSAPLLAYLEPGRFGTVKDSFAFPFPKEFSL
jgi:flavin reductase (DIM6/NTAB) family NADH-FMN oxidoreductase RutF